MSSFFVFCLSASHLSSGVRAHRTDVHFPEKPHDCKQSLTLFWSSDSFLNAFSHILEVELAIAEMACVSRNVRRTLHVPSGVPVQRSISERDVSYPVVEFAKAETQAFLALSARLYKSLTAKLEPSSALSAFAHIL